MVSVLSLTSTISVRLTSVNKEVVQEAGAWMANFNAYPILWILPAIGLVSPLLVVMFTAMDKGAWAFPVHLADYCRCDLTCGTAMFPFIMPSSIDPNVSPDHVGCNFQPVYSPGDDGCCDYLCTTCSPVHHLVLREDGRDVLISPSSKRTNIHCTKEQTNMWYFAWILGTLGL